MCLQWLMSSAHCSWCSGLLKKWVWRRDGEDTDHSAHMPMHYGLFCSRNILLAFHHPSNNVFFFLIAFVIWNFSKIKILLGERMCCVFIADLRAVGNNAVCSSSSFSRGGEKKIRRIPSNCVLEKITWEANDDCKLVRGLACSYWGALAVPHLTSGSALSQCWSWERDGVTVSSSIHSPNELLPEEIWRLFSTSALAGALGWIPHVNIFLPLENINVWK